MDHSPATPSDRLVGWKEIAAYLGKSVRAVQRWEQELGLPVHRVRSNAGQSIYASRSELDRWLAGLTAAGGESTSLETAWSEPASRRLALAGVLLLVLVVALSLWMSRGQAPSAVVTLLRFQGSRVDAVADDGSILWSHRSDRRLTGPHFAVTNSRLQKPVLADVDGDGVDEVFAVLRSEAGVGRLPTEALYCWTRTGKLLWQYQPREILTFEGGATFGPTWTVADFAVSPGRGVWASFTDGTWWANFVARIAPDGAPTRVLTHGGIVYRLMPVEHQGRLLVYGAAVSNHHASVALVVIDPSTPARWPVEPSGYRCVGCPSGAPTRYVLLPPSDLLRAHGFSYNNVRSLLPSSDGFTVETVEQTDVTGPAGRIFRFEIGGKPLGYAASDGYQTVHRLHEVKGLLQHPAERCPDAAGPIRTQAWTPEAGWQELTIPPDPLGEISNRIARSNATAR